MHEHESDSTTCNLSKWGLTLGNGLIVLQNLTRADQLNLVDPFWYKSFAYKENTQKQSVFKHDASVAL